MGDAQLLVDEFERIRDAVYPAVNGLSGDELAFRPSGSSNSIAWLAWHLTRVEDRTVSALSGGEQVWTGSGWFERFGLALDPADTGYGHDPETVGRVTASAASLLDYFEDVHQHTVTWLQQLDDAALSNVLDATAIPPVTVGSRVVDAIVDCLQHVGQAAYVRGLIQHR